MLDNNALNLVADIIKAIDGILQVLVDLAAANELDRIPSFDFLIEQFKPSVVAIVGIALDAGNLEAAQLSYLRLHHSGTAAYTRLRFSSRMTSAEAAAAISSSDCVAVGWRRSTATHKSSLVRPRRKNPRKVSKAAPTRRVEHFGSIPVRMDASDSRLPSFGQQTEFALQRSETRFRRVFDHPSALT